MNALGTQRQTGPHKLARPICTMLSKGQEYTAQGQERNQERDKESICQRVPRAASLLC